MRLPARLPLFFVLWFISEVLAFALVVHWVGLAGAIVLSLLTSIAGVAMLRRLGLATAWRLRRALSARSHQEAGLSREAAFDGALVGIGSLLLILPGFVSDFFGLALAAPSVRAWFGDRVLIGRTSRGRGGRKGPALVELDRREWSRLEGPAPRPGPTNLGP